MKIVVIGAGFGGLAAAALLGKKGHDVTVVEKNDQPGGRATKKEVKGFLFDRGPSWYLMPEIFEELYNELEADIGDLELTKLDPSYKVFVGDRTYEISPQLEKNKDLFESVEEGAGKQLEKYLLKAEKLYESALGTFVKRKYLSIFDVLDPRMLQALQFEYYTTLHNYVKKYFKHPDLQKILEYTMVFLGGSPKNTPALYSIMSHVDLNQGVFYPKGGMHKVALSLYSIAKKYGVHFAYEEEVTNILVEKSKVVGVKTKRNTFPADTIVANADYPHVETTLLERKYQTYPASYWKKKTIAPSGFIIYLGIDKKIPTLDHHNLFLEEEWDEHFKDIFDDKKWPKKPSYYVCAPSKTDKDVAPTGCENLFVLVPVASGLQDTATARRKMRDLIMADLSSRIDFPLEKHIIYEELFAHKDFSKMFNAYEGTALGLTHTMDQTALLRPLQKSKKVKGLYYVGQFTHPGVGVPMVLLGAQLVSEMIP